MNTVRAVRTIQKDTSLVDVDTPTLGHEEEMNTEPLFVGICGTDLQIIRRQRPDPATILGHEGIAYVIENSSTRKDIQPGDLVVFNPVDPTDQNQILGHNIPGLLQEQYLISEHAIKNDLVVPFPKDIEPMLGALVEPLGTVTYGHILVSKVVKQSIVAIVGAGAIGIMHALHAKAKGYERVLLINASRDHLDWCVQRGIINKEDTFLDSETLPSEILSATQGIGVDAVYMCTSRPNASVALKRALRYIRAGGCIDLVGGFKDGDKIRELPGVEDLNSIRRANFCGIPHGGYIEKAIDIDGKMVYLTGHRGTSSQHFKDAIESLRSHGQVFNKVISHIISLEACVDLFSKVAKGQVKEFNGVTYVKAVVDLRLAGNHIRNIQHENTADFQDIAAV